MTKPHLTPDPERLSATAQRTAISSGKLNSATLVRACLARIEDRDKDVRAWVHVERKDSRGRAGSLDRLAQTLIDDGWLIAPGSLFHASPRPTTLMRVNFATAQDARFWRRLRAPAARTG
jgi:Asp-tRNA(Asn)/Glu-tRNA(Gln) amidotransferase A subunit family amidase